MNLRLYCSLLLIVLTINNTTNPLLYDGVSIADIWKKPSGHRFKQKNVI